MTDPNATIEAAKITAAAIIGAAKITAAGGIFVAVIGAGVWWIRRNKKPKPKSGNLLFEKVPHPNPNFFGRDDLLRALHGALTANLAAALTQNQAVTGMGGIGKTELAKAYCHKHRDDYAWVFWLAAEDPSTLGAEYAALAHALDLPEKNGQNQTVIVGAVRRALEQADHPWLLVFDNAEDEAGIKEFIPNSRHGHVVITSRNPHWTAATPLEVPLWTPDQSRDYLIEHTGEDDREAAESLAEALGNLPLAVAQAAAYMAVHRKGMADYLRLLEDGHAKDLRAEPRDFAKTVAATFGPSFDVLTESAPAAAELLGLCAFLAPEDIPLDIIRDQADQLPDGPLKETVANETALGRALGRARVDLERYSLAERSDDAALTLHRLVQAVTRDRLGEDKVTWSGAAARVVNAAFPFDADDVRFWPACDRLLPHALAAADHCGRLNTEPGATAGLFGRAAVYLHGRASFAEAEPLMKRALKIDETAHGRDHPKVATALNNLALLYRATTRLDKAEQLMKRALRIDETSLGPDHPSVARDINNLALLYLATNRLAEAEPLMKRALRINETSLGPDHPNVATALNNLAQLYQATNRLVEAEPLMKRALNIYETSLVPDHPNVATALNNLAQLYRDTNRMAEAEPLFERALKIDETSLVPDHPEVATDLNNLAQLYRDTNRMAEAEPLFERALGIFRESLGPDHPDTLTVARNLDVLRAERDGG